MESDVKHVGDIKMKTIAKKILLVLIGIGLDVIGRLVAGMLNIPIWLDAVGTFCATCFGGIWTGLATAVGSKLVYMIFDATAYLYIPVAAAIVVLLHICVKKGYTGHGMKCAIAAFWLGMMCALCTFPIYMMINDGYPGNSWGDILVIMLRWNGVSASLSALAAAIAVDLLNVQACMLITYLLLCIAKQINKKRPVVAKAASFMLIAGMLLSLVQPASEVRAAEEELFTDHFSETIYNNVNGMVSSEANVICETNDGYIWIGSYAGLTRYDGNEFQFVTEGGLVNVVSMMTDSKGRLWIGTNDAGIARYANGRYTYFTVEDGLSSNSIRCFAEDADGNIYVGTSAQICCFGADDTISVTTLDVTFAQDMVAYEDVLVVMDNAGHMYAFDDEQTLTVEDASAEGTFYGCLGVTERGLVAGTENGELLWLEVDGSQLRIVDKKDISTSPVSAVFEDGKGRLWAANGSGFGYIDAQGSYQQMHYKGFDSSIDAFHEDYQGNIWIASSRYGVMKLSAGPFINVFEKAGIANEVVNAICYYDGDYYCGTDNRLIILDGNDYGRKSNELTEYLEGSRVRAVYADTEKRLWICTYSGLICYGGDGSIRCYESATDGISTDRFRCITELSDGTMVAGTVDGICVIENDEVAYTVTEKDGMVNTQILSVVEGHDGTVWAASDGSGIYVISEGRIIENYTVEDGLSSDVVLRIVPYGECYLIVTSNALCHMDADGTIRKLANFPYFNNYDVIIDGEKVYIPCSAGLYEMSLTELCEDEGQEYRLYAANDGLLSGLTANSWNYVSEDGVLYLCSNNGVIAFDSVSATGDDELKFGIAHVECDGVQLGMLDGQEYVIPGSARNISIYASVRNYAFSGAKVRFYVEELEENPKTYAWNEVEPIHIFQADLSEYHICLQILDATGEQILEEKVYTFSRDTQIWKKTDYQIYLGFLCVDIAVFGIISVIGLVLFTIRKNELEEVQVELEKRVAEQTEELREQEKMTKEIFVQTVTALSEAVDAKDRYTSGHSKRVAEYAQMLAARMGKSKEEQEEIYRAGLLHDVGKIRIPVEIINKTGKLTDEEFNVIKIHPVTGYHILRGIPGSDYIAVGAKFHHERYDGNGYPNGLSGDNIPEVARILGVADSYDAMTSNRSYRKALPQDVVRGEIEKGKGTQFDPEIAELMLQLIDEDTEYTMKQDDALQKKILVVDDDPISIKMVTHIMRDEPMYEISSAPSGSKALEILDEQSFELILLDMMMPEMDGLETLKRIREKYDTTVALMTGDRDLDTFAEFAAYGCDDYITKPFQALLLKETIYNLTERIVIDN